MTRNRVLAFAAVAVGAVALSVVGVRTWAGGTSVAGVSDTTRVPQGQLIVVEVLNASGTSGLAKRATFLLRDRGFDVVSWGNDPAGRRSETLIVDYTNKPEAADRLARVLGGAQIEAGKDSLDRGLDLTVRIGSAYRPSVEAFHP